MAKKDSPRATAWDKISGQDDEDTLHYRDVAGKQQLDRSKIEGKQGKTGRTIAAVIISLIFMVLAWGVLSGVQFAVTGVGQLMNNMTGDSQPYYKLHKKDPSSSLYEFCLLDEQGAFTDVCYPNEITAQENPPQWVADQEAVKKAQKEADLASGKVKENTFQNALVSLDLWKLALTALTGFLSFAIMYPIMMRNLATQNLMSDTTDVNQYAGDQHIALPEEIIRKFNWFPDSGAHSSIQVSSMISHVMLTNKGLNKIEVTEHAREDVMGSSGAPETFAGEILYDENDLPRTKHLPAIDETFGEALFDASEIPAGKKFRRRFDATAVEAKAGRDGKSKGTMADFINKDWTFPEIEMQRPSGVYLVDSQPTNTMVIAITRAGKGQGYIEPVIDMWTREEPRHNMVINDPKGELLVRFYVRATLRGYQVIQFNLMNPDKTDIYNTLGIAAEAARQGDTNKCALYISNIADVFFPVDGGEDPVWPNAANAAFKRAAFGLIDVYLEEEREMRAYAAISGMDLKLLETRLDEIWGKVTPYNCYQMFVQLSSKKQQNPVKVVKEAAQNGKYGANPNDPDFDADEFDELAYEADLEAAEARAELWKGQAELDQLTLFFNANEKLPRNSMRNQVANANSVLTAMATAEKMLASVYGIAITAMSFFTDPTIATLTSGTPAQNVDLGSFAFPRRMGVRFNRNYLERDKLIGMQVFWDAFEDEAFTKNLGKDFEHSDVISRDGWARYFFTGIFEQETAYLRLRLKAPSTGYLVRTFYFRFTKAYQTSLDGRRYITDPILGTKVIRDGLLVELVRSEIKPSPDQKALASADAQGVGEQAEKEQVEAAGYEYKPGAVTYPQERLVDITAGFANKKMVNSPAIMSTMARYSETAKALFLVTPPHMSKYAKLLLILIRQLVDSNFDMSYMTKEDQKPMRKTRFMLDEVGNLQSDGHGIAGLETMLSIGLGQEQQFTLILQTLQQLRDVYGESVDKILQGNIGNIIFLKSTDDAMIETLSKMSGTRHTVYRDSKTVTKDMERVLKIGNVEGKVSYTMSAKEEPVLSYNDFNSIANRNSIVLSVGGSPIWNRNETALPMAWRLFKDVNGDSTGLVHPGHRYSLKTLPTLSSAIEFDVLKNQPDFERMLRKRILQAIYADDAKSIYQEAYGYSPVDVARLDPDVYSEEVMALIDESVREQAADLAQRPADEMSPELLDELGMYDAHNYDYVYEDTDVLVEQAKAQQQLDQVEVKRFAGGQLAKEDLINMNGSGKANVLDREIIAAYKALYAELRGDKNYFTAGADGSLRSRDGQTVYISVVDNSAYIAALNKAAKKQGSSVYAEEEIEERLSYEVTPEFYAMLGSLDSWVDIARGQFEKTMAKLMAEK